MEEICYPQKFSIKEVTYFLFMYWCQDLLPSDTKTDFNPFLGVYLVFDFFKNLEVSDESAKKHQNSKEEQTVKSKKYKNTEIEEKAKMVEKPQDAAKLFKRKLSEVTKGTLCSYHTNKV